MYIYKIINHREKTIKKLTNDLNNYKKSFETYNSINEEYINRMKRNIFSKQLERLNKEGNLFYIARKLRGINILKMNQILNQEIEKIKDLSKITDGSNDFKEDLMFLNKIEEELAFTQEELNTKLMKFEHYPTELIDVYNTLFKKDDFNSQYDIVEIKNKKIKIPFLNQKEYKYQKAINKYYDLIKTNKSFLLSENHYNLFEEYNEYKFAKINLEKLNDKIFNLKNKKTIIEDSIEITKEHNKELQFLSDENNLTNIVYKKFFNYIEKENLYSYYIENINEEYFNEELFKEYILLTTLEEFNEKYKNYFNKMISHSNAMLTCFKLEIKKIKRYKEDEYNKPLFSNIGYFENKIIDEFDNFIDLIKNLKNKKITTNDFNLFNKKELKKSIYLIEKDEINIDTEYKTIKSKENKNEIESYFDIKEISKFYKEFYFFNEKQKK